MSLKTAIEHAADLTAQLQEALKEFQPEACLELLAQRGQAMSDFEAVHEAAAESERESCRTLLRNLVDQDQGLRSQANSVLDSAKDQLRASVGTQPNYSGTYHEEPTVACLDRKA